MSVAYAARDDPLFGKDGFHIFTYSIEADGQRSQTDEAEQNTSELVEVPDD